MSYNTPKVINVFYKEDRKPYDINGKAISYFGEDFIGSNDATKIRFYLQPNEPLDGITALVHAKRADSEVRFEILTSSSDDLGNYFELVLNSWFTMKVGKVTLSLKLYSGDVVFGETEGQITSIESVADALVIASDIFTFNVGYAPNATEVVPPFIDGEFEQLLFALSQKPDFGETIHVVATLPTLTGDVYDNQWFLVKGTLGKQGKLYHINGSVAEEVELGVGSVQFTPSGNGDVEQGTIAGLMKWNEDSGTLSLGLFDEVEIGLGESLFWFVKAQAPILKGEVVQFAGNVGGEILVKKAVFSEITAQPDLLMGVALREIDTGYKGYILASGRLENINTSAFTSPILYLSTTTAGALSSTKPTQGFKGSIAAIGRASTGMGSNGFLLVRPNFIKGIGELTDVTITSVVEGDVLRRQGTQWVNSDTLSTAEANISTLQGDVVALDGRVTTNENDIAQLQVDVVDLDNRIELIEDTGGIDFIKVATFSALPSSGDARLHRLFLTEDTKQLWEFDGTQYNESSPKNLQNITITSDNDNVVAMRVNVDTTHDEDVVSIEIDSEKQVWVAKDGKFNVLNEANLYGDLTIAGNLTVNGTQTIVNTTTLDVEDNIITINKNQTGTPEATLLSGIEVERGDETNFQFVFQESSDLFKVGQVGDLQAVATREDTPTDKGVAFFNASTNRFETNTNTKVNASGQLVDTTIRNSGVAVKPLTINAVASTTANLQEWQINGTNVARLRSDGALGTNVLINLTAENNSNIVLATTGTTISRNIADANPSLIVNLANSSSTGNITNFQFAGANKLEITRDGFLTQNGTRLFSQPVNDTNTFFGNESGRLAMTGTLNTGFGKSALASLTSGVSNVAFGRNALNSATTSNASVAVGTSALALTNANENVAIGYFSGYSITSGTNNTFLGYDSGSNASQLATATNSTAIGNSAYTDASNQMVFGNASVTQFKFDRNSGATILAPKIEVRTPNTTNLFILNTGVASTGSPSNVVSFFANSTSGFADGFGSSILLGASNDLSVSTNFSSISAVRSGANNTGRLFFSTNNAGSLTEKMTIMPDGKVGIGTSAPVARLSVAGTTGVFELDNSATNEMRLLSFDRTASTERSMELRGSQIRITTDANERMRVLSTGLVGINETSPTAQLQVKSGATTRVPLVVDTLASHTALLAEYKVNGTNRLTINSSGNIGGNDFFNISSFNNALLQMSINGAILTRNIADTNPALIVNLANSGATGNIVNFQKAGTNQAFISGNGYLRSQGVGNITNSDNALLITATTGSTIYRNIADANPALIVNQQNSSSTGNIVSFQKAGSNLATIANNGVFVGQSRPTRTDITANATLALADEGKVLRVNPTTPADNITITVPKNSAVAFPIDTEIAILRYNSGTVTIAPVDGDVTINSANGNTKIKDRYSSVALKKIGTNEWVLVGSLEA